MLRFSSGSWLSTLFVYYGGVMPKLLWPVLLYTLYASGLYALCVRREGFGIASDGIKLLAGSTTFMLVFRLNQCHSRLQEAQRLLVQCICSLRAIVALALAALRNSKKDSKEAVEAATMVKVHICRLAISFAVSIKFHMRAAEMMNGGDSVECGCVRHALSDLVRIKALLTESEARIVQNASGVYEAIRQGGGNAGRSGENKGRGDFSESDDEVNAEESLSEEEDTRRGLLCSVSSESAPQYSVDLNRIHLARDRRMTRIQILGDPGDVYDQGGCAIPPIIVQFLRFAIMEPLAKPWGYPERVLNLQESHLNTIMNAFQGMNQIVGVPLPLPYCQLCKLLLLMFILLYPLSIDVAHGIWGNIVVPTLLAMTLIGFENVADFMENPLGDDSADISIYEIIHEFEVEVEAIFNSSSRDLSGIMQSWGRLGAEFGLSEGCALLSQPSASEEHCHFKKFFVWQRLPRHTIQYILDQSSDIHSLNSRYFSCFRFPGGPAVQVKSASRDSEEGGSRDTSPDRYEIQHCIALKSALPHIMESRLQAKTLEAPEITSARSFRRSMSKRFSIGGSGRSASRGR